MLSNHFLKVQAFEGCILSIRGWWLASNHWILCLLVFVFTHPVFGIERTYTVGSKRFTENYIVGEIFSQLLESRGFKVEKKMGLGGTMVAYSAITEREIDIYPEYTGTIAQVIISSKDQSLETIRQELSKKNLDVLPPLGFDNTYCLVMNKEKADQLGIQTISDLAKFPKLKGGLGFEFQARTDGWKNLKKVYSLKNKITSIEVPLTYEAVQNNKVDFAEAYSTEPLIKKMGFIVLKDDRKFFPKYEALAMVHKNVPEQVREVLRTLSGRFSNKIIMDLNGQAVAGKDIGQVARDFLVSQKLLAEKQKTTGNYGFWIKTYERVKIHLFLTCLAVFLASLVAFPFAFFFAGHKQISQWILGLTGILQTFPSIALLAFMIPLFGIGTKPAIMGLFIYSLLPILRNAHTAITQIDPRLITAARGIGLYPMEIFFLVKFPLAFPTILAGIRTATTLNIGTATLAAFIGAGGLGEPIVAGLALNDTSLILEGAIPAAVLAVVIDGVFGLIEKLLVRSV